MDCYCLVAVPDSNPQMPSQRSPPPNPQLTNSVQQLSLNSETRGGSKVTDKKGQVSEVAVAVRVVVVVAAAVVEVVVVAVVVLQSLYNFLQQCCNEP